MGKYTTALLRERAEHARTMRALRAVYSTLKILHELGDEDYSESEVSHLVAVVLERYSHCERWRD